MKTTICCSKKCGFEYHLNSNWIWVQKQNAAAKQTKKDGGTRKKLDSNTENYI
jgi:hypothetical protein